MNKSILLAHFPKISARKHRQLLSTFSSVEAAWQAGLPELMKLGWEENFAHEFLLWKSEVNEEKIGKILEQEKIHCVFADDAEYPPLLKEIYDPPFCLFVRGELKKISFPLAVVGPRAFSLYGKQVAEELVTELARRGLAIVSGLAIGIDGIAHEAALASNGRTIAVLGGGNDRQHVVPAGHRYVADKIIAGGGAVITEYPPGVMPTKYTFPRRNRIIAGMTLGTLVIEAGEESGSLITAQCALDNGREVFAVPQNIHSPTAVGVNNLLKMGAKPVTSPADILDALNLRDVAEYVTNRAILPDSPIEAKLLEHLSREPLHVDQLTKRSSLDSPTVNSALTIMEMKGKVRNIGGMMYVLAH